MHALDDMMRIAGQIAPADVPALAAAGVTNIVNNRPDGEEPGQPTGAQIAEAAWAAGIGYVHLPVAGGLSDEQVAAMAEILDRPGVALAFCKSGTRSTFLWALARARLGDDPEGIRAKAEAAGYDLSPIARYLQSH